MNDNLLPLTLKRQLSKEGKLLLVRSLSHDEDNDADNTIMIGANDDGSVNTLAQSLTLIQHPVLGKLPLVRIINSFLEYDNFVEKELANELAISVNYVADKIHSINFPHITYLDAWNNILIRSKRICKIGRKRLVKCSAGICLKKLLQLNHSKSLAQLKIHTHGPLKKVRGKRILPTTILLAGIYWNKPIVIKAFLYGKPRVRKINKVTLFTTNRKHLKHFEGILLQPSYTALQLATALGHVHILQILFKMNELNVNFEILKENIIRGSINGAALHIAIQYNRMKCFKLLLQHKDIDVNLPVHYECYTPLMMCAIYGRFEMMEILLLQKNIDVNFVTKASIYYNTAIKCACVYRQYDVLNLLFSRCQSTIDPHCGGNIHLLSCLYKHWKNPLDFKVSNPIKKYKREGFEFEYREYKNSATLLTDEWKEYFHQIFELVLQYCRQFEMHQMLSQKEIALYLNYSNSGIVPFIISFALSPLRRLHHLTLLIENYPLCVIENPTDRNGNNVLFYMLIDIFNERSIDQSGARNEDVEIMRKIINTNGYNRDDWAKQNRSQENVFTILRRELKKMYNNCDENGFQFVKMLAKMFGVNQKDEYLNKLMKREHDGDEDNNNNNNKETGGNKYSNKHFTNRRSMNSEEREKLAEKKLKKKKEQLNKRRVDKKKKNQRKNQRNFKKHF